ncbi:hypothetical protein LZ318_28535 [Saccharopolyspora indica]|uniref:hypothetical protein n=1 Tax=Saccharopolyspora indica TaxID=1229659 RepID=UPI0022EAE1BC|nr:hypothetical protein [Saccharopolyspora indica]MDA3645646.1 hypothetical protein [Saccharopolyspora indica]
MTAEPEPGGICRGCKGRGQVRVPRGFFSAETGEAYTVMGWTRCRHCRATPGRQQHQWPPRGDDRGI